MGNCLLEGGCCPSPPTAVFRRRQLVEMDRSDTVFDVSRRIYPNRFTPAGGPILIQGAILMRRDRSVPVAPPLGGVGSGFEESGGRGALLPPTLSVLPPYLCGFGRLFTRVMGGWFPMAVCGRCQL